MRSFLKSVKIKIWRTSPTCVYLAQTMKKEILRYGWDIGDYTYGTPVILGKGTAPLSIGRYTSIAQNVLIILDGHNISHTSTYPFANIDRNGFVQTYENLSPHSKSRGGISIGSDVYIGASTIILSGVTIGDGAVIGAGSVVRENVEPYAVHFGSPARFIKFRFQPELIRKLLEIRYWEMHYDDLVKFQALLREEPAIFLKYFQKNEIKKF